jgi:hypothetical protein
MEPFNVLTQTRHGQMLVNRHDVYIGRSPSPRKLVRLRYPLRPKED